MVQTFLFSQDQEEAIQINSLTQTVVSKNCILFEGEVEVVVGHKFHIWADRVEVDYEKKELEAFCKDSAAVSIELEQGLILASYFMLDLEEKTGMAENLRVHTLDGYIAARRAEKIGDREWYMYEVSYSACDADNPHWQVVANKACFKRKFLIDINWLFLKVGSIPIFVLPRVVIPLQNGSLTEKKSAYSGFLIPKFYIDYDSGLGFKQEYYQHFSDRFDTTVGLDWREQRGIGFFDELRWIRSPKSYTLGNVYYALARHNFKYKEDKIISTTRHRYWISAKDFFAYSLLDGSGNSLMRADFGTDKRIGYQFFDSFEHVDDSFYNTWLTRLLYPHGLFEFKADNTKTSRRRFFALTQDDLDRTEPMLNLIDYKSAHFFEVKEIENRFSFVSAPALSWHTAYYTFGNHVAYRHDFFLDHVFYREREYGRVYRKSFLIEERGNIPLKKAQLIRFDYFPTFELFQHFYGNYITARMYPIVQMRSLLAEDIVMNDQVYEKPLFAQGSFRALCGYGAQWSLPEYTYASKSLDMVYALQPEIRWDYVPFMHQKHWFFMDDRDRIFPQMQLEASLFQQWMKDDSSFSLYMSQGYEWNKQDDILPARRSIKDTHITPFQLRAEVRRAAFCGTLQQEYDVQSLRFLSSEAIAGISLNGVNLNVGYLFQSREIQQRRTLLSNISHFLLLDLMLPIGKCATLQYAGQFYVEKDFSVLGLGGIKPLFYTIRFDYNGHCYGFYVGYEEKKYREFGHDKHERAFVFSLRLNSLGSFAKRFKRPHIMSSSIVEKDNFDIS